MKKILTGFILVGFAVTASAQEWKLGLGVSYRQFDDVEFSNLGARNFGEIQLLLRNDGTALDYTPQNLVAVTQDQFYTGPINVIENVVVTSGYGGAEEGIDSSDGFAPVLTAEYLFMTRERLTLGAVFNFQYFTMDLGGTSSLALSNQADQNQYFVVQGNVSTFPNDDPVPYNGIVTTGYVSNEFEMDLYAFDLGLKLGYSFDCAIDLFVAVGPSVNIVDLNSEITENASYSAPGNPGGSFYSQSRSDGGTDVLFGLYGAIGGQYWINEQVGVVLEARYDEVFDKATTDFAELDLSGFSGMAKVIFRF